MTQQSCLEHMEWLCSTPLMDLEDPALRLRVQRLTQLKTTRRAKVLAVYAYVKRLELRMRVVRRRRTATEVLRAGGGDAAEKATLFVAMLRLLGVPARMRFVHLRAAMIHGFGAALWRPQHPIVEAWTGERWAGTDTYIFDTSHLAAARQRLLDKGRDYGRGIHVHGASTWDGLGDAYASGYAPEHDPMAPAPVEQSGERAAAHHSARA
jgi:transglutaminase-like putative cysteine protease